MEEDYIVGYTLFEAKYNGFKTCHRHFSTLEGAERFASNVNIKDSSKIYVNIEAYKKLEEVNKNLNIDRHRILKDNLEILKQNGYPENLNYRYVECPKVEAEFYKSESYIKENYIPKSVIEEKIEEVQEKYEETLKNADFKEITTMNKINFEGIKLEGQRAVLQELLEKGDK